MDLSKYSNSLVVQSEETPFQLLPPLTPEEFQNLKDDIRAKGVLVSIELDEDGVILDGHHRLQAVKELEDEGFKIPYDVVIRRGLSYVQKEEHVLTLNLKRRHLSNEQRVELFVKMRAKHMTLAQIAEAAGMSITTVWRSMETFSGEKVDTDIPDVTAPVIPDYTKGKDGKFRPTSYVRRTVVRQEERDRLERAAQREQERNIVPDDIPGLDGRYALYCGDFRGTDLGVVPSSVDAIITDPPYPEEYLPLYRGLGEFAARTLRPGGFLAAMVGQTFLPTVVSDILAGGGNDLTYYWTLAYLLPGAHATQHGRKTFNGWKPILLFIKGGANLYDVAKFGYYYDVVIGSGADKSWHIWGQDLEGFMDLVRRFSAPGDLIVDPFNGGGTTGIAALALNRRYTGIDLDPSAINATKVRIAEFPWDELTPTADAATAEGGESESA